MDAADCISAVEDNYLSNNTGECINRASSQFLWGVIS